MFFAAVSAVVRAIFAAATVFVFFVIKLLENLPKRIANDKRAALEGERSDGLVLDQTFEIKFRAN